MFKKDFLVGFLISSILSLVIIVVSNNYLLEDDHMFFLMGAFTYFVIGSFFLHIIAQLATKSKDKFSFSRVTMANTFLKLFVLVLLVVIYKTKNDDKSIDFVWPFILCYVIFTIFETRFLMKLAKN